MRILCYQDHFYPYELRHKDRDDVRTLAQYKVATVPAQKVSNPNASIPVGSRPISDGQQQVGEKQMPDKQAKPGEEPIKL